MYCIGVPFKRMWCFYQVRKINWLIHRILGMYKYTVCHSLGTFCLFIHSFDNVKTIQGYLDLQSTLRKEIHKSCFSALQDCIGTEGFKRCSSCTWHSQRNRGKR